VQLLLALQQQQQQQQGQILTQLMVKAYSTVADVGAALHSSRPTAAMTMILMLTMMQRMMMMNR
jgi:hypothetical protein